MENPAPSIIVSPIAGPVPAEFIKQTFRTLYMRRSGAGSRELTVPGRPSDQLGKKLVTDCPIYDGRGSDASLVARIQGVTVHVGNADALFTMVFESDRLKGSTLLINGMVTEGSDEWAIYGGTREFAMATGVIKRKNLAGSNGDGNSDELTIEVFRPVFGSSQPPNKEPLLPVAPVQSEMKMTLYSREVYAGSEINGVRVIDRAPTGTTWVFSCPVSDGQGTGANIIGHLQGTCVQVANSVFHYSLGLVFRDKRFNGSTLQIQGTTEINGEWSIVGGTGELTNAKGTVKRTELSFARDTRISELNIHVFYSPMNPPIGK